METDQVLRQVGVFSRMNRRQLARLGRHVSRKQFAAGERIIRRGERGTALYVIVQGRARVTDLSEASGAERELGMMVSGEAFGEIALLDGKPRSATVTAAEPTECLLLHRSDFEKELAADPSLAHALLLALCERIRRLQDRLLDQGASPVTD